MKKTIQIKYNSIFKYETHKETIKYKEIGIYEQNDQGTFIRFKNKDVHILIQIQDDTIWLTNNQSTLQLIVGQRVTNRYVTMYGDIHLDTFMESFEDNGNIKMKYRLLEGEQCISEVYILIHIQVVENENETKTSIA